MCRATYQDGKGSYDQGSQVAREHYGCNGWVSHQNTDIWRVAGSMDALHGALSQQEVHGCAHNYGTLFYLHGYWLISGNLSGNKGSVDFFMDFSFPDHP